VISHFRNDKLQYYLLFSQYGVEKQKRRCYYVVVPKKGKGGGDINKALFKMALERAGYTQCSLAKKMGCSKNTLNNKVNGHVKVTTEEAKIMCELLHIDSVEEKCQIFLL